MRTRDRRLGQSAEREGVRGFTQPAARYLTDGRRLFRVVHGLEHVIEGGLVCLEDCASLQLLLLPADELPHQALRPVAHHQQPPG